MSGINVATVNDVFVKATSGGERVTMLWQDSDGAWKPITATSLYGRVRALAETFLAWGVERGERIAILSENRWEWAVTDFAALAIGAVDVPLYSTLTAEQVGYMLRDSGAKVAVVSTAEQFEKLQQAGELPALEHVVVMDKGSFAGAESFDVLMQGAVGKERRDELFDGLVTKADATDPVTIIYTSGTTGEPKGVVLTHDNLASNLRYSTSSLGINEQDSCISFLPLSHVTARHVDYAFLMRGVKIAYCPRFDLLPPAMKAVHPTIFVAVPRVYEKIRHAVTAKSSASPVIAVNNPAAHRIGTVGKALENVECRFAEDGELEVRGPSIFAGYWNKPKETAEAFTRDGWFKTGDIGMIDAQGFLSITDRKKELLKTSGGKLIAPQPIENKLKANPLVNEAAVVGDKHKFACVLVSPNFAALDRWAKEQGVEAEDRVALVQDARVIALYEGIVKQVNGTLAHFEDLKRVRVVADEWSVEGGEMTPSMKLKRRVVEKKYSGEIAEFYRDEATATR